MKVLSKALTRKAGYEPRTNEIRRYAGAHSRVYSLGVMTGYSICSLNGYSLRQPTGGVDARRGRENFSDAPNPNPHNKKREADDWVCAAGYLV